MNPKRMEGLIRRQTEARLVREKNYAEHKHTKNVAAEKVRLEAKCKVLMDCVVELDGQAVKKKVARADRNKKLFIWNIKVVDLAYKKESLLEHLLHSQCEQ